MSYSVIGGADGPTSVFVAGKMGIEWINLFGLAIIIVILIPNIIYAVMDKDNDNKCNNKIMCLIEQIGRYTSMFLMIFNIGIFEFGFSSVGKFLGYGIGNICLVISYLILWIPYMKKKSLWNAMALAIIPTCIFVMSGALLEHYLLVVSGILFGVGHIYVTYKNQ